MAVACRWLEAERTGRLLPLLSGDTQTSAVRPCCFLLERLGDSAEDHRRCFRGTKLGPTDQPFTHAKLARQHNSCSPGTDGEQRMLDQIVLEQFVEGLLTSMSEWMR
ncbi:hypothetical protein GBF38_020025 [Nibea albiflora]|uniref:Uncharacterized protein n=1 Tax=Nibea albiflora TaxID=240163 RepID=A0ACB7FD33_NIBAL|nr:hypothetical protein GBF38_020025 [Nibea albiflora]